MITDQDRQAQLLPGVSRTFALTIPQLPQPLRTVVTNAYLLCRIADTIEDDVALMPAQKAAFHAQFREVLAAQASATDFSQALYPLLSTQTPPAEQALIKEIPVVIRCLRNFTAAQQATLQRCVNIMSTGMPEFQQSVSINGLAGMEQMDRYCYYVAGVVGEMLTELFCQHSPAIAVRRQELMPLAVSFGQGLQMTNILKDFWEDRKRGVCWLPQDIFQQHGVQLAQLPEEDPTALAPALRRLISIACGHLQNALRYTLLMPSEETGIRRFALWAIGLAVLTLRNIQHNPAFNTGAAVKVSRRTVKMTILVSNLSCRHNQLLTYLFKKLTRELA